MWWQFYERKIISIGYGLSFVDCTVACTPKNKPKYQVQSKSVLQWTVIIKNHPTVKINILVVACMGLNHKTWHPK